MKTRSVNKLAFVSLRAGLLVTGAASAGDCTGYVVGVRPVSQYNHATGAGFLAVRSGPGTGFRQIGEVYAGDEVSVWSRSSNWYEIYCMGGRCSSPLWGPPNAKGWVSRKYISASGVCPK